MSGDVLLRLDDVTKRFGSKVAVDGVSLEVRRAETLGIVGESGSGKSTIARLVVGLERPTSGALSFDGRPYPTGYRALRALRQRLGMVFQSPSDALDPHLGIGQIVTEPLRAAGRRSDATPQRATALLAAVGLQGVDLSTRPGSYSGGEQQRIAFARALALEPELIVCDEPTSSLDVSVQAQILNLMLELQERTGVAFVLISHDLDVIRRMSDRVVVMRAGQAVETGAASDITSSPEHPYTRALLQAIPRPRWQVAPLPPKATPS